jgi:hypothetical protein
MTDFGRDNPRDMPLHLFRGAVRIDYGSAVRANTERQNCSICPRYWYVDAAFRCQRCGETFTFTADEQRAWYEQYRFWIDSLPKHCLTCRGDLREVKDARREYDQFIEPALATDNLELKERIASVIDHLCELGGDLPPRIHVNRRRLARDIATERRRREPS